MTCPKTGILYSVISLEELNNSDNLEDGRPSNTLFTYYVTDPEYSMCFEPHTPQYKKLKNETITSLTLRVTDHAGNFITNGPGATVVFHNRLFIKKFKNGIWKMIKPRTFTANSPWNRRNQTKRNCHSQSQ